MTRFLTTPVLYGLLSLFLLVSGFATVQTLRLSAEKTAHAQTKATNADAWTAQANLATKASEAARRAEQLNIAATLASKDQLDRAIEDGNERAKTLADAFRAGERRMRDFWAQGATAPGMPPTDPADTSGESTADLQAGSIERIDRALSAAEARVNYLIQRHVDAEQLCRGTP